MPNSNKLQKQITKLEKAKAKPVRKAYPFILAMLIVLVHLLDTYATDICTKVQSLYVNDFFVLGKGMTFENGLQRATIISTVGYAFTVIGPFYKALMDKVGRKPIFIINTAGMALGMLLCWFSPNFIIFALGQLCIVFFAMHDMQMLYIYEVAPVKWRSTLYFACKFIGVFGTIAIPYMRDKFVQADGSGWRNVFIIPAVIGFVLFAVAILFMRESPIFLDNRLANLKHIEKSTDKENAEIKTGIFPAVKYIFTHGQLKWLAICIVIISTSSYAISMYYESYLSTVYSTNEVTNALYLQPVAMSIAYLSAGIISDKLGRKPASCIFAAITLLGFFGFLICVDNCVSPTVVGILLGLYLGCYWNITDINALMFSESAPTEIRGSIMGTQVLLYGIGTAISLILCMVLLAFLPLKSVMLILGIPGLVVGSILIFFKLKETKGINLSEIKYEK